MIRTESSLSPEISTWTEHPLPIPRFPARFFPQRMKESTNVRPLFVDALIRWGYHRTPEGRVVLLVLSHSLILGVTVQLPNVTRRPDSRAPRCVLRMLRAGNAAAARHAGFTIGPPEPHHSTGRSAAGRSFPTSRSVGPWPSCGLSAARPESARRNAAVTRRLPRTVAENRFSTSSSNLSSVSAIRSTVGFSAT